MFVSLAAGLQEIATKRPTFREEGCCSLVDLDLAGSRSEIAKDLRRITGERASNKPPEEFLDLMLSWAFQEKAAPDTWYD